MYSTTYSPKLAAADLRTVIKLAVNTPMAELPPPAITELEEAKGRLATLTGSELLDVVAAHLRSGMIVGRYIQPPRQVEEDSGRHSRLGRMFRT